MVFNCMNKDVNQVIWHILSKLDRMGKIGGSHTEIINLEKGLPMHFRSSKQGKKIIQKVIKEMIDREYLLQKPSTGEIHISLNPRKLNEIKEFVERYK